MIDVIVRKMEQRFSDLEALIGERFTIIQTEAERQRTLSSPAQPQNGSDDVNPKLQGEQSEKKNCSLLTELASELSRLLNQIATFLADIVD